MIVMLLDDRKRGPTQVRPTSDDDEKCEADADDRAGEKIAQALAVEARGAGG